jgi:IclR family transcriptional regulator, acetate operon repressor
VKLERSDNDRVKALEKALNLLLLLGRQKSTISLDLITQASKLNKTTCFRLLKTLQDFGFVEQEPGSKNYRLGAQLISLGAAAMHGFSLRRLALPYMQKLQDLTQETVNLSVLNGNEIVFIERLEAGHIISTHHRIGDRLPAYSTCMGKAIMAYLPGEKLTPILDSMSFEPLTPKTLRTREAFLEELERVRLEGLSYNIEELEKGLCAVAAPIIGYAGEAVAALNVAFPLMRHDLEETLHRFAPEVKRAAGEISKVLGFSGGK